MSENTKAIRYFLRPVEEEAQRVTGYSMRADAIRQWWGHGGAEVMDFIDPDCDSESFVRFLGPYTFEEIATFHVRASSVHGWSPGQPVELWAKTPGGGFARSADWPKLAPAVRLVPDRRG